MIVAGILDNTLTQRTGPDGIARAREVSTHSERESLGGGRSDWAMVQNGDITHGPQYRLLEF